MSQAVEQPEISPAIIFQMREMTEEDLNAAEDKLYRASSPITVLEQMEAGLFDYYIVRSGDHVYEVTRLGFFAFCTCKDFQFSGTGCKHIPQCLPKVCRKCFAREVDQRGKICSRCEMDNAPYLKISTPPRPVEIIGGVRI